MGAEEFKVSFKGILFNKRRVRNEVEIRENYDGISRWYFHFSVLYKYVSDL